MEAEKATEVAALFSSAVTYGRFMLEELAPELKKITLVGAELGISLEKQMEAVSLITIKGGDVATTMTHLRNMMIKSVKDMQNPSSEMSKLADRYELDLSLDKMQKDFVGWLGQLKYLSEEELVQISGSRSGMQALLPLVNNIDEYIRRGEERFADKDQQMEDFERKQKIMEDSLSKKHAIVEQELNLAWKDWGEAFSQIGLFAKSIAKYFLLAEKSLGDIFIGYKWVRDIDKYILNKSYYFL
jgi:hypothetical protein